MVNLIEIGKSGIKVPFLGMGTWAIGGGSWSGDMKHQSFIKKSMERKSIVTFQRKVSLRI